MGIHVTFTDGTEPYIRYRLSKNKLKIEVGKLSKKYHLRQLKTVSNIIYYEATPIEIKPFATEADA